MGKGREQPALYLDSSLRELLDEVHWVIMQSLQATAQRNSDQQCFQCHSCDTIADDKLKRWPTEAQASGSPLQHRQQLNP